MAGKDSAFWPYLQILPNKEELDLPLYWSNDELMTRLSPSGILTSAQMYWDRTRRTFEGLQNVELLTAFFPPEVLTLENYIWVSNHQFSSEHYDRQLTLIDVFIS